MQLSFLNIRNSENQQSLQGFHIALGDEGILLLRLLLQLFFKHRQELSRSPLVGRQHAVDHHGITMGDARRRPKAFVGLGKEGEAAKLIKELLLQGLKFLRLNRPTVVVVLGTRVGHCGERPCGSDRWRS